jgi:Ser-tRNA(Ala) deacylase AlaX
MTSSGPLSSQDAARVEAAANRKVAEDAEILEFEMDREEAEGHFGESIYDLCEPPAERRLEIVRIPEWEVACCSWHRVSSTGVIGAVKIDSTSFDEARKELAVKFHLQ